MILSFTNFTGITLAVYESFLSTINRADYKPNITCTLWDGKSFNGLSTSLIIENFGETFYIYRKDSNFLFIAYNDNDFASYVEEQTDSNINTVILTKFQNYYTGNTNTPVTDTPPKDPTPVEDTLASAEIMAVLANILESQATNTMTSESSIALLLEQLASMQVANTGNISSVHEQVTMVSGIITNMSAALNLSMAETQEVVAAILGIISELDTKTDVSMNTVKENTKTIKASTELNSETSAMSLAGIEMIGLKIDSLTTTISLGLAGIATAIDNFSTKIDNVAVDTELIMTEISAINTAVTALTTA